MPKHRRKIRLAPIDLDFFEKKRRLRVQPRFVVVAFGDTIKFREWEDLYLVSSWESWKFVERLYKEFTRLRNGSIYVKPLADGFMAIKELSQNPKEQAAEVIEFLKRCCRVADAINPIIKKYGLKGFRIRVVAGYVGRLEVVLQKKGPIRFVDYTGKPISLAFSLLPVNPYTLCICFENVKSIADLDPKKAQEIIFEKIVDVKDLTGRLGKKVLKKLFSFGNAKTERTSRNSMYNNR
jgi:hypothetical protein